MTTDSERARDRAARRRSRAGDSQGVEDPKRKAEDERRRRPVAPNEWRTAFYARSSPPLHVARSQLLLAPDSHAKPFSRAPAHAQASLCRFTRQERGPSETNQTQPTNQTNQAHNATKREPRGGGKERRRKRNPDAELNMPTRGDRRGRSSCPVRPLPVCSPPWIASRRAPPKHPTRRASRRGEERVRGDGRKSRGHWPQCQRHFAEPDQTE
jgi:hypothetical protein